MSKNEFLDILRTTLSGKISNTEIENNIKFYEEFITSKDENIERDRLDELGDPRLIARTIIESFKRSKVSENGQMYEDMKRTSYGEAKDYQNNTNRYDENYTKTTNDKKNGFNMFSNVPWYKKILFRIIIILIIILFIFIGSIAITVLFKVGFPLLMLYIVYRLISSSWRK